MTTISTDLLARGRSLIKNLRQEGRNKDAETVDAILRVVEDVTEAPSYLTTGQVAQRLGVSRQTIVNWTRKGLLPGLRLGGRTMVPATALDRFASIERLLDELDAEREPGTPEEVAALVSRGREHWTWKDNEN
jgi:excisionase family DNA binding protein